MRNSRAIYGPPGTGKTTRLLREIHEAQARGVPAREIAFTSFSNNAVDEMVQRAGFAEADRENWGTVHSLARRIADVPRASIADDRDASDFAAGWGSVSTLDLDPTEFRASRAPRNPATAALSLASLARARQVSLREQYERSYAEHLPPLHEIEAINRAWSRWKTVEGKFDFDDLLELALRRRFKLGIRTLVIDEAADLSRAQLGVLKHLAPEGADIILAGDDDQAIYTGLGAAGLRAMREWGPTEEVLHQSYRLPDRILTASQRVIREVQHRVDKRVVARDSRGRVRYVTRIGEVDLPSEGSVLVLVRRKRQLHIGYEWANTRGINFQDHAGLWRHQRPWVKAAKALWDLQQGRVVTREAADLVRRHLPIRLPLPEGDSPVAPEWLSGLGDSRQRPWYELLVGVPPRDVETLRHVLRDTHQRQESFFRAGRVRVTTIHAAKGSEADHVILLDDVGRFLREQSLRNVDDLDSELRVRYVAMTRARETLTIVEGGDALEVS